MDPIEGVHIHVTTARSGLQEEFVTDVTGEFKKKLTDEKRGDKVEYLITLSKDGYLPNSLSITKHFTRTGVHTIWGELQIQLIPIEVGDDLGQLIALEDIYFDFDKANIRPDAAIELDKIVEVMNDAPNLVIELGSHTDCRGDDKYNQILSEKRAKSSAAYIKARISNPERISGKGYGESQPVNDCGCGKSRKESECTEEEHQLNRRTEFRIVEMD